MVSRNQTARRPAHRGQRSAFARERAKPRRLMLCLGSDKLVRVERCVSHSDVEKLWSKQSVCGNLGVSLEHVPSERDPTDPLSKFFLSIGLCRLPNNRR